MRRYTFVRLTPRGINASTFDMLNQVSIYTDELEAKLGRTPEYGTDYLVAVNLPPQVAQVPVGSRLELDVAIKGRVLPLGQ